MRYSVDVIDKARDEIQNRRNNALKLRETRIKELKTKAPEIAMLTKKLADTNVRLCHAIIGRTTDTTSIIKDIERENLATQSEIKMFLKEYGYPEDYLDFHYTCKNCKDNGSVMGVDCECYKELLMKYAVMELNKKCNIRLDSFEDFKVEFYPDEALPNGQSIRAQMIEAYKYCVEYAEEFDLDSPSLIFKGNTGLGKTFLSSAIAKYVTERGFSVVFDSVSNVLRCVEDERFGRSDKDTFSVLLNADLVILDDFGSEGTNKLHEPVLYEIINGRINKKLPMIISTNYSSDELDNKYNERIISRISSFNPIYFYGNDIRQLIRQKA